MTNRLLPALVAVVMQTWALSLLRILMLDLFIMPWAHGENSIWSSNTASFAGPYLASAKTGPKSRQRILESHYDLFLQRHIDHLHAL